MNKDQTGKQIKRRLDELRGTERHQNSKLGGVERNFDEGKALYGYNGGKKGRKMGEWRYSEGCWLKLRGIYRTAKIQSLKLHPPF